MIIRFTVRYPRILFSIYAPNDFHHKNMHYTHRRANT